MPIEKNKNIIAVGTGLLLIIIIALITFFRPEKASVPSAPTDQKDYSQKETAAKPSLFLSSNELLNKINSEKGFVLIDVRPEDDFKIEHILDSQNIPLDAFEIKKISFDKQKTYVIIDSGDGAGVSLAQNILPQEGFERALYLDGGFQDWKNNDGPTVSAGDPSLFVDQSKVNYLKSEQFKKMATDGEPMTIIDLRSEENFQKGHIENSLNIFLDDLEKRRAQIPRDKKIVLYDKDGLWAFQGSVRLFDMGFSNVFCLSDGLDGWIANKYPITAK